MTPANSTTDEELRFDDNGLNTWTDEERFEVTRERLAEYAAATNDPIPAHRSGEVAPPVFAIVPVFEALLVPAVDVLPVELIPRVVHGEQDFHFHRPIRPGDKLVSRGKMIGYEGLENGTRAAIYLECRTDEGELVNEQYVTTFVRGFDAGKAMGELSPAHRFDEGLRASAPVATVSQHVDADQTFRYSPAAGDPMPIHLDEEVARDAGLPGIIAHGLCTMAFTSWAVLTEVAGSDVNRLKRFAVRFSKMVLPGDDLETRIWRRGSANGVTTYAFETARGSDLVITDGLAEIAEEA
ncbi:MaoC/PaaZ C-terminal domain-containing protein [Mycolicibacterium fortuitum]|uniref:MaoC/PaaZ C-terminal domain-containing protein n=2 Tax=Mycolicibacterium fortuitum TaxID=1766 RepID=A0AAE5ACQ9_MYCFO|nr:MaoC/PaaZ C-terminal domain-containing protein [Mycolicibacterium fortuitum]MBP3081617.1 MaoC family dehydratase N-terminal domain-containing protein [Mycolicibacterium fortuitum]MCV7140543.1 MaoC family dehydratase N-terminal domain-containing protein [Mycolicibacterium fortuitum]MDV7191441.1 MaoC/PaaZ C-terminal domain-containing protein [Mycolicibacterium fortuitum]MDV7208399.1 MaoC/PaaZ C-terminal domain-containing protein [Mycolicibacterium fortuitum]MDV7225550.1 MaoC/PaaZ C-terminal d